MSHRNDKRKAAIWLLENICVPPKMSVNATVEAGKRTEFNQKKYDWFKLKELIPKSPYDKNLLRDACDLLRIKEHIDVLNNEIDRFDIEVKALKKGEVALREDFYQDDIDNYNSDKRFRNLKWLTPLIALIIATASLIVSTCKKSIVNIQLPQQSSQQSKTHTSDSMAAQTKIALPITDTTVHNHASNGQ